MSRCVLHGKLYSFRYIVGNREIYLYSYLFRQIKRSVHYSEGMSYRARLPSRVEKWMQMCMEDVIEWIGKKLNIIELFFIVILLWLQLMNMNNIPLILNLIMISDPYRVFIHTFSNLFFVCGLYIFIYIYSVTNPRPVR